MKIALLQTQIIPGKIRDNCQYVDNLLEELPSDVEMVFLPELWNTGYDKNSILNSYNPLKCESVKFLQKKAKDKDIIIFGGSVPEYKDGKRYNTMAIIGNKGELLGKYRKVHLFPYKLEEEALFESGEDWGIFRINDILTGAILCYDLRFPEFCRNLAIRGTDMIFVASQWPHSRINQYKQLLIGRAIENQCFVIGVNGCCEEYDIRGGSMVVSPDGNVLLECGNLPGIYITDINRDILLDVRNKIPVMKNRVNILDEIDNNML